jgi:hypothetical protein
MITQSWLQLLQLWFGRVNCTGTVLVPVWYNDIMDTIRMEIAFAHFVFPTLCMTGKPFVRFWAIVGDEFK